MDQARFWLTRVCLRQYRSIAEADVKLGSLLLLVGPNGSGKSNFLDALRLVSESLQTSLDQALRNRGGVSEVRRRSTGHPTHFAVDLEFRGDGYEGDYGFEIAAVRGGGFRVKREYCDVWLDEYEDRGRRYGDVRYLVKDGKVTEFATFEEGGRVAPPANDDRLYLVYAGGLAGFRPVFDGLSAITVFNLNPDVMRQPQTPDPGEMLLRDGRNVASVLHRLTQSVDGRKATERIAQYLELVVPGIRGVSRADLGSWETLEFRQDVPGSKRPWKFQAQSVSDGTLRALGVLVSLFAGAPGILSTMGIEEPESALHPAATSVLMDALRDASERRQVIVTSHSPDLLDRHDIDPGELRAVRSVGGETKIGQLDSAGMLALREQLYTPGELLRTDQLLPELSSSLAAVS